MQSAHDKSKRSEHNTTCPVLNACVAAFRQLYIGHGTEQLWTQQTRTRECTSLFPLVQSGGGGYVKCKLCAYRL